ncbi:MAG: hypothetical protein ACYDHX_07780 [Methanothrix sp.]
MATNTKTLSQESEFARLPKTARQKAYEMVRAKVGPQERISVTAMMQAHNFRMEMS